jgi:signal transduction histidine kinase
MHPMRSLLWRVAMLQLIAVAALSIVLPLGMNALLNATTRSYQDARLQRHEQEIAHGLHWTSSGWRLDLPADVRARFASRRGSFDYSVLDERGHLLFTSLPHPGALFPAGGDPDRPTFQHRVIGPALYYGAAFPERIGDRMVWVQFGQNLQHPDVLENTVTTTFLQRAVWLLLPILGVLVLVDFFIVRHALGPVLEASEQARAIGPANLSLRLPVQRLPAEIAPLAEAVNQALDRLEQGFKVQREFTADAAHELRTPLAILRMRIANLADKDLGGQLASDIDGMARIVGQLLDVAELDAFVPDPGQVTDLRDLGQRVVEYMAPLAAARGRRLSLAGTTRSVWVTGEDEVLFHAVRNLVENAIAHTPPGGPVEVKVEAQGVIRVLDRGPGLTAEERELVFRRFWRRERSTTGGAGLGLAIVSRIVEAHGGDVGVHNRPGGGAVFSIRLKRATAGKSAPAKTAEPPPAGADPQLTQAVEIEG